MKGPAVVLALSLWGCGDDKPVFNCLKDQTGHRACTTKSLDPLPSFKQERAHCFRNGPRLSCTPTELECVQWLALDHPKAPASALDCRVTSPEEFYDSP